MPKYWACHNKEVVAIEVCLDRSLRELEWAIRQAQGYLGNLNLLQLQK
jgi:hypothetical protein